MVCTKCGTIGADVRPNWTEREMSAERISRIASYLAHREVPEVKWPRSMTPSRIAAPRLLRRPNASPTNFAFYNLLASGARLLQMGCGTAN
jgi:hypothetical protein